ncbi:MAG: DUF3467 domain-containing protein [Candidatus Acidiferrum sp.]
MEREQEKPEKVKFQWIQPKETTPEIYCNLFHPSWTLFDVRLQLGQLIPIGPDPSSGFGVEQRGAVTLAWPEAKALRDALADLVARSERVNGEIKPLKLPSNTDSTER